jgi:HK97 family phage prohead protease
MPQTKRKPSKFETSRGTQFRYAAAPLAQVLEMRRIESDRYVEGYASTFDVPYTLFVDEDGDEYREVIESGAFAHADMSDVIMQFDHRGMVLARQRNKTLVIEPDSHGLFVAADLSGNEQARQLYESIQNGLVDRMSWAFTVSDYEYDRSTRTNVIRGVSKVFDVSAVSLPADEDTEISARGLVHGAMDLARQELAERERVRTLARIQIRRYIQP